MYHSFKIALIGSTCTKFHVRAIYQTKFSWFSFDVFRRGCCYVTFASFRRISCFQTEVWIRYTYCSNFCWFHLNTNYSTLNRSAYALLEMILLVVSQFLLDSNSWNFCIILLILTITQQSYLLLSMNNYIILKLHLHHRVH